MSTRPTPETIPDSMQASGDTNQDGASKVAFCAGAAIFISALAIGKGLIGVDVNLPHFGPKDGGKSDPAPRGQVIYEQQRAVSTSSRYLTEIGRGEATVFVKAKQNYDKPGTILNGDWKFTNNTPSVSDPNNHDLPARLTVNMRYCADGIKETTAYKNEQGETGPVEKIKFSLGTIMVCGADFDATSPANDAAFNQDDAPRKFKSEFNTFIIAAVNTIAAAAPCPRTQLESSYTGPVFALTARANLAEQSGLPIENVEIIDGTVGTSDAATQDKLRRDTEDFANRRNPNKPEQTYPALNIQFGPNAGAIVNSCYQDVGSEPLPNIEGSQG